MTTKTDTTLDDEAKILARAYALILSFSSNDDDDENDEREAKASDDDEK